VAASDGAPAAYDIVVVGSGIAGLMAALAATESAGPVRARVALVTQGALEDGCTRAAQGGIAAALGDDDSAARHLADTLAAGRGLCDEAAVRVLVGEAPARIADLEGHGVRFDRDGAGRRHLAREAGHGTARVLHAGGDASGLAVESALAHRLRTRDVALFERHRAFRLLLDGAGRCVGVDCCRTGGTQTHRLLAPAVVLASGGAAGLWQRSTNPPGVCGSGMALAYEAGADIAGMEFVQFHPTVLALPGAPAFLISEAVRGEGAHVVDHEGRRFLAEADPRGELAPRDVVAAAIAGHLAATAKHCVYLDCAPLAERVTGRFPTIARTLQQHGIDLGRDLVPIAPAAHYTIGGVRTDIDGATCVEGLFACGEVASSGVHGANRLASNSLLEGAVFGHRAGRAALQRAAESPRPVSRSVVTPPPGDERMREEGDERLDGAPARLRQAMWQGAGMLRGGPGLQQVSATVDQISRAAATAASPRARTLAAAARTASLVCEAAALRAESRGCHLRSDHPHADVGQLGTWVLNHHRGARFDRHARSDD